MTQALSDSPVWHDFERAAREASLDAGLRIIDAGGLAVDLSGQPQSDALTQATAALLEAQHFAATRQQLYDGGHVNWTEDRPAWHTALRAKNPPTKVAEEILSVRARMRSFVADCDASQQYRDVLHLGIGGSDWGPRMVIQALRSGTTQKRRVHFVSNVDSHAIEAVLKTLDPKATLIIIASKSFTTLESLANAKIATDWLRAGGVTKPFDHVVALTANVKAARELGVADTRVLPLWDWVGGRYSVWSSIGLPIALALGMSAFEALLEGAASMDAHFLEAPIERNAPVQMAVAGVIARNVLGYGALSVTPYDSRLSSLVPWLQQLDMESLGKSVLRDGSPVGMATGPAVFGLPGTDCQHTFFQWMHQEAKAAPIDFILTAQPDHSHVENHKQLVANCLAQRAAMMRGKSLEQALAELGSSISDPVEREIMARHRVHPGGRPTSLIVLPRLSAQSLGALLALYEHKIFTQGVIWGINPFDQWGVEFGKQLARRMSAALADGNADAGDDDASTRHWLKSLAKSQ